MMKLRYKSHSARPIFDMHKIRNALFPDRTYGEVVNKYYEEKNKLKKYRNVNEYLLAAFPEEEEEDDEFEQSEAGTENNFETSTTEEEENEIHQDYSAPTLQPHLDFDFFFGQEPQLSPEYSNYSVPQPKLEDGLDLDDLFVPPLYNNNSSSFQNLPTPVSLQNPFDAISNNTNTNFFNFPLSPNKFGGDSPLVLSNSQEPAFDAEHQIKE